MPTSTPSRILIIKPSALGDVIQALPVATGLKRHWPQVKLDWVVNDTYQEILAGHPAIDQLWLYRRKRWTSPLRLPEMWRWGRELRDQHYDIVIDLQGLLRSGLMTGATRAPRRIGLNSAREGSKYFYNEGVDDYPLAAADRYLCVLSYLGVPFQRFDFQLKASTPLPLEVSALAERPIVIHPYSRWRTKLWPFRYYQDLIRLFPGKTFVLVGEGPWFPIEGGNLLDLRGKLNLSQLMSVLQYGQATLSTDSGPAHLSAALGTPTLTLFGATDWRKTKPAGNNVKVVTNAIFCAPCLKRSCYRDVPMQCLTEITPEMVAEQLNSMLP